MAAHGRACQNAAMALLFLEALLALALLLFMVWWTLFSGRRRGELRDAEADVPASSDPAAASAPADMPSVSSY